MAWGRISKTDGSNEPVRSEENKDGANTGANLTPKKYSDDDGGGPKADVGDSHYHKTFDRDEGRKQNAANSLLGAEKGSTDAKSSDGDAFNALGSVAGQRRSEESAGMGFKNSVAGLKLPKQSGNQKNQSLLKRASPMIVALLALCGVGGASIIGQASLPVSLMNNLVSKFDSIGTSNYRRSKALLAYQTSTKSRQVTDSSDVNNYVKKHAKLFAVFSGEPEHYFKISKRQKEKFAKRGITVESDGNGNQVLRFTNTKGEQMTIVADQKLANPDAKIYHIDDAYASDADFRNSYFESAKTWRGAVGAWFDSRTKKLLSKFLNLNRNTLKDVDQDGDDSDVNKKAFQDVVADVSGDEGINGKIKNETGEYDDNPDGDKSTDDGGYVKDEHGGGVKTDTEVDDVKATDAESAKASVEASVSKKVESLTNGASQGVDFVCTASEVIGGISTVALVYQMAQTLKVASVFFEGIQKSQVEDSSSAPMNTIGNLLTTRKTSSYEIADIESTEFNTTFSGSETMDTKKVTSSKSAMESASVAGLYGGYIPSMADPSLQTFNLSTWLVGMGKALGLSAGAFKTCTYARLALAVANVATDVYKIASCFLPPLVGCIGGLVTEFAEGLGKVAFEIAKGVIKNVVISAMVPFFGNMLARGLATKAFGEDLGNTLVSGASMYMGRNHQYSGGAVADKKGYLAYLNEHDMVLAEKAQYERETLSPFDISSQYTMLGSIYQRVIPVMHQTTSITGGVKNIIGMVGASLNAIIPGASAASNALKVEEIAEYTAANCKDIDSIGGLADEFCNPYIITDMSTIGTDPAQIIYNVYEASHNNFEDVEGDTPKIKEDSKLAKYIIYCNERESPFGLVDQNISNAVQGATTGSAVGDGILSAVPVVGGILDGINSTQALDNYPYINGEACVTNNTATSVKAPEWKDAKNYQRFIEDQRIAESMGIIEQSAVTAFLDDYYEKNPKDNSYEGILARYTGMTKENVIIALDAIDALEFLASYEPSEYGPVKEPTSKDEEVVVAIENNSIVAKYDIYAKDKTYSEERRVRNFAI